MNYGDEKIIKLLNGYKSRVSGNIYDGYYIKEDLYRFVLEEIFADKLYIYLPIRFIGCEEISYLNVENMDFFCMNKSGKIQLGFKKTDIEVVENKLLESTVHNILEEAKKVNSSIELMENGKIEISDDNFVYWRDYKVLYGKKMLYVMLFVLEVEKTMTYGKFTCGYEDVILWKPIFVSMLDTIEVGENRYDNN